MRFDRLLEIVDDEPVFEAGLLLAGGGVIPTLGEDLILVPLPSDTF